MAIIVNDVKNLPETIIVSDVKTFQNNGVPEEFLKELLKGKKNGLGAEFEKHYMLTTSALLRFAYPKYVKAFMILRKVMDACYIRGYHHIMIKKHV